MAIKGATFDLQTVLAKYDGAMYNALSNNHDGYVSWTGSGNPITFTDTNVLTLKNGYILVHGRLIVVDGATDITLNPGSSISSGDGRLVLQIDTSRTNTQTVLNQVEILQEYKATASSWRALSTDDINALSTGVYEVQLCHFTVANGTSSSVVIDISTDTLIGNLQADIETLADNLEQTASDVGDLQALGLSVPIPVNKGGSGLTSNPSMLTNLASAAAAGIFQASPRPGVTGTLPIANGGTNGTTKVSAQQNLGISYEASELTSGTITAYADALSNREHKVVLGISGQSVTDLPDNATSTLEIYKFDTNSIFVIATKLDGSIYIKTKRNGTWGSWQRVYAPPQITKITFNGNASAGALQNLAIQSAEVMSGSAFVDTTTSAWNYYVPVGTYRITLQAQFPTGSATDYYGLMAGRDATPNYSLACQFGCGLPVVQRLNASGIMVNTNSSEAHSLIVRSNKALTDCSGFLTIEKLT